MKNLMIILTAIMLFVLPITASAEQWAEVPLKYMSDNGYLTGGEQNSCLTRLEAATVIAKLPLVDKNSNYIFTDTSNKDIVKVSKSGIMSGVGNQRLGNALCVSVV